MNSILLFLFAQPLLLTNALAADECKTIRPYPTETQWVFTETIKSPGRYCLTEDLTGRCVYSLGSDRAFMQGGLQNIAADDVDIDLRGFWLNGQANGMQGMVIIRPAIPPVKRVTIRNGRVTSRTGSAIVVHNTSGTVQSDFLALYKSQQRRLANTMIFSNASP